MIDRPLLIAHRGASSHYRENSPSSWRGAVTAGADIIEADTRITKDHRIVISHDADLTRVAGKPAIVAQTTFSELQELLAEGEPAAPALAELFATVPTDQALLYDIKDERPEALALLVEASLASGRKALIFGVHHVDSLVRLRALGWRGDVLGLLVDMEEQEAFFAESGTVLRMWEDYALSAPERLRQHVQADHAVWITTGRTNGRQVGDHDASNLLGLAEMGASGFLVNDPAACRNLLNQTKGASE